MENEPQMKCLSEVERNRELFLRNRECLFDLYIKLLAASYQRCCSDWKRRDISRAEIEALKYFGCIVNPDRDEFINEVSEILKYSFTQI